MTQIKVPFDSIVSSEFQKELQQFAAVKEVAQDEKNQLLITLESDKKEDISQILNKISEYQAGFNFVEAEYPVEKMTCGGCSASAERLLNNQAGVLNARVDFPTKSARVFYKNDVTSPDKLKLALDMLGYDLILDK